MAAVEPLEADFDSIYQLLLDGEQPRRQTGAELVPADLKQLVDIFCEMQDHICTVTNGLWVMDVSQDAFRRPSVQQITVADLGFRFNDGKATSYEDGG